MSNVMPQPTRVEVMYIRMPPCFTTPVLAATRIFREVGEIIRGHVDSASSDPTVGAVVNSLRVVKGELLTRLGQPHNITPTFDIPWLDEWLPVSPVYHGSVKLPGHDRASLYVVLSAEMRQVRGEYEEVNLVFLRPGDVEWVPFYVNEHGLMAVVSTYYPQHHLYTPLDPITQPLWQLRGLPTSTTA